MVADVQGQGGIVASELALLQQAGKSGSAEEIREGAQQESVESSVFDSADYQDTVAISEQARTLAASTPANTAQTPSSAADPGASADRPAPGNPTLRSTQDSSTHGGLGATGLAQENSASARGNVSPVIQPNDPDHDGDQHNANGQESGESSETNE